MPGTLARMDVAARAVEDVKCGVALRCADVTEPPPNPPLMGRRAWATERASSAAVQSEARLMVVRAVRTRASWAAAAAAVTEGCMLRNHDVGCALAHQRSRPVAQTKQYSYLSSTMKGSCRTPRARLVDSVSRDDDAQLAST